MNDSNVITPFTEGLFIKASEILRPRQNKLIDGLSLSPNTSASRIIDLAAIVEKQLLAAQRTLKHFQLLVTKAQMCQARQMCCVYQGYKLQSKCKTQEFLDLIPMKGTKIGRDI